jgi:small subunit ribosomal protein S15
MAITREKIQEVKEKYGRTPEDTGSPEFQIALLTEEILNLTKHLQKNPHDFSSKSGLIMKVSHRRKLLKYLEKKSVRTHKVIVEKLNL